MRKNIISAYLVLLVLIFTGGFIYVYYGLLQADVGPEQPIPFSHNVHSGVKQIQCQYCHPYVAYSNHPGIPPVEKCLHCHNYIIANHPWIKVEHRYFNTETSTPWVKVNYVAEHVLFNHQRHINGQIACRECHGPRWGGRISRPPFWGRPTASRLRTWRRVHRLPSKKER